MSKLFVNINKYKYNYILLALYQYDHAMFPNIPNKILIHRNR